MNIVNYLLRFQLFNLLFMMLMKYLKLCTNMILRLFLFNVDYKKFDYF